MRRKTFSQLFFLFSLSFPLCLLAGPTEKRPSAEEAMANGERELSEVEALRLAGDHAGADAKLESARIYFSTAHDLAPEATGPLLGMGLAEAQLKRCDDAIKHLGEYLDKKAEGGNPAAKEALQRCKVVTKQAGSLAFQTKPIGATVLLRQGETTMILGPAPTVPKVVEPGEYEVLFVQSNEKTITRSVTIKPGEEKSLKMDLKHPGLSRLSWDPGALGVPHATWWFVGGMIFGAAATTGTLFALQLL